MLNLTPIELIFLVATILITPKIASFLVFNASFILKKIHQTYNNTEDENIIFSCWGGTFNSNLLYQFITLIMLLCFVLGFFNHHDFRLYFFGGVSLLAIFIVCWNSLTRIELTIKGVAIYKMQLGTDTELHRFKNKHIKSVHKQLAVGQLFSGGLNSWLIIKLHNGEEIFFPPPTEEDAEMLFGFLENKKIIVDVQTNAPTHIISQHVVKMDI